MVNLLHGNGSIHVQLARRGRAELKGLMVSTSSGETVGNLIRKSEKKTS